MGKPGAETMSAGAGPQAMHELDEPAFDRAEAAWHDRYLRTVRHGDAEQAHHEAIAEAREEFLGVYERERSR